MKILIVKTSSLGDVIQSLPVLDLLYQRFPTAQIDWVIEHPFQEMIDAHPKVYRAIVIETRKWRKNIYQHWREIKHRFQFLRKTQYDLLFDLQGNVKSGIVTGMARAKEKVGMTISSASEWPSPLFLTHRYCIHRNSPISFQYLSIVEKHLKIQLEQAHLEPIILHISAEEEKWISSVLIKNKKIMVCSGAHWKNKKLPVSAWIQILTKETPCHFYFVWGLEQDREDASALHHYFLPSSTLLPKMSLPVWQRLMMAMDAIYTVDSSALHLAGTTTTPTYSFFGPSSSSIYKPFGSHHRAFQAPCPYGTTFVQRCPMLRTCQTGACMKTFETHYQYLLTRPMIMNKVNEKPSVD